MELPSSSQTKIDPPLIMTTASSEKHLNVTINTNHVYENFIFPLIGMVFNVLLERKHLAYHRKLALEPVSNMEKVGQLFID